MQQLTVLLEWRSPEIYDTRLNPFNLLPHFSTFKDNWQNQKIDDTKQESKQRPSDY